MRADLWRVARLLAATALVVAAAGCGGDEQPMRIGLLTDCRGVVSGYEDQMLAGAELPLLERGARLTNGKPSGGVSGARVAGREVELVRGCTELLEYTILVEEARRLVELEGVDAVVGLFADGDSLVLQELARKHPEVIFVAWSLPQELTLRNPAANVYRFGTDGAQDVAGLGSYAYRELGWRRAAVVGDPSPLGWQGEAAFVAEFCALGGNVTARFSTPIDLNDTKVAQALQSVDGVAALVFGGVFTGPEFLPALARAQGSPETRIVVGPYGLESSTPLPAGVVGASSIPPVNSTPAMRRHQTAFTKAFLGLPPGVAETPFVLGFHDAMEGLLRGLEAAEGDLSDGRRRLREELARVRFDLPSSPVRLDRNRQAVRNVYLKRIDYEGGKRVFRLVRVVPDVEQTFGGLLSKSPPPGPGSQPCRKATPPPWAR